MQLVLVEVGHEHRDLQRLARDADEVVLLEPVTFKISAAPQPPIEARSEPALSDLKAVIDQHPEWVKIEVQGHTDNTGNAKYNETLSAMRAESVKKWLVEKGVAAERLVVPVSSGLIAGESLMGIGVALLIVMGVLSK